MNRPLNPIDPTNPKVPMQTFNEMVFIAEAMRSSAPSQGHVSSLGLLTRPMRIRGVDIRIFEVRSQATGDGVYNCYEQKLDATYWDDTGGNDRFINKDYEPVEVEVFNLLENDTESTYSPALAKYDLIAAWQRTDDEGNRRWEGIPCVPSPRRAITTQAAPAQTYITANLYDRHGTEITSGLGSEINVYCDIVGGGNLDDVMPILPDNQEITVYNQQGKWKCTGIFQTWPFCET